MRFSHVKIVLLMGIILAGAGYAVPVVSEVWPSSTEVSLLTQFRANASDPNNVSNCSFVWAGSQLGLMQLVSGNNSNGTWEYNYSQGSTGSFEVYANCTNVLGESAYNSTTVTVSDTTPPIVGEVSPTQLEKKNYTESGVGVRFTVSASDNSGDYSCHFYWDGQDMGTMSSSKAGLEFSPSLGQLDQMTSTAGQHHAWANCSDPSGNSAYNDTIVEVFTPVHVTLSQRDCVVDGQSPEYSSGDDYSSKQSAEGITYQLTGTNFAAADAAGRQCFYYSSQSGEGDRYVGIDGIAYVLRMFSNASDNTSKLYFFNSSSGWQLLTVNTTYGGYYVEFATSGKGVEVRVNTTNYCILTNYTTMTSDKFGGYRLSYKWPRYYTYSRAPSPPNITGYRPLFMTTDTMGIAFNTDEQVSCNVYCGAFNGGDSSSRESHELNITGLSGGSEYNLSVKCCYPNEYFCQTFGPVRVRTADQTLSTTGTLLSGNLSGVSLNVSVAGSGDIRASRFQQNPVNTSLPGSPVYYFDVYASAGGPVNVTIHYNETDLLTAGVTENEIAVYHWNGSAWNTVSASVDPDNNLVTFTLTSLSPVGVGGGSGGSAQQGAQATVVSAPGIGFQEAVLLLLIAAAVTVAGFVVRKNTLT